MNKRLKELVRLLKDKQDAHITISKTGSQLKLTLTQSLEATTKDELLLDEIESIVSPREDDFGYIVERTNQEMDGKTYDIKMRLNKNRIGHYLEISIAE